MLSRVCIIKCYRYQPNPGRTLSNSQKTSHTYSSCSSPVKSERISSGKEIQNRHNLPVSPVKSRRNQTVVSDIKRVGNGEKDAHSAGSSTKTLSCEHEKTSRNKISPVKSSRKSSRDFKSRLDFLDDFTGVDEEVACSPAKSVRKSVNKVLTDKDELGCIGHKLDNVCNKSASHASGTNEQSVKIKKKVEGEVKQKTDAVKSKRSESSSTCRFIYEIKGGSSISKQKDRGSEVQEKSNRALPDAKLADQNKKNNSNLVGRSSKRRKAGDNDCSSVTSKIILECPETRYKSKRSQLYQNIPNKTGMNTGSSQHRNLNVPYKMRKFESHDENTDLTSIVTDQITTSEGSESKKTVPKADLEVVQIGELGYNAKTVPSSVLCMSSQKSKENMMNNIHHQNAHFSDTQTLLGDSHIHSSNNQITNMTELDNIIPLVKTRSGAPSDKPIWNSILSDFEN